jgi:nickel-dependent lactate racemase
MTKGEYQLGPAAWAIAVPPDKLVPLRMSDPGTPADARTLVRHALESPFGFEPMRRATTPDDRVVIVVDDRLPCLADLLSGVLEHLASADIKPEAVTILLAPPARNQGFIDDLPDEFSDVTVEVHNPDDDKRHAYLAATAGGRRVYLNRTLADSDFTVILTGRRFDPILGFAGAADAVFPTLSNAATRAEFAGHPPAENPFATQAEQSEAQEVTWLLGTPFFVQVIEGDGNTIHAVIAGLIDSAAEGVRVQRERWAARAEKRADLVIAAAAGDESDLANALANASRVVAMNGKIVLLAEAPDQFGEAFGILRRSSDPTTAAKTLLSEKPDGTAAAVLWAFAARSAKLHLGPDWSKLLAEDLFATPLRKQAELDALISSAASVAVLPEAHKLYATVS